MRPGNVEIRIPAGIQKMALKKAPKGFFIQMELVSGFEPLTY